VGIEYVDITGLAEEVAQEIDFPQGVTGFTGLYDTPSSYIDATGKFMRVNSDADALEYSDISFLNDIVDAPESELVSGYLKLDENRKLVWSPATTDADIAYTITGATHFTGLLDTPTGYEHGKYLQSNNNELQYIDAYQLSDDLPVKPNQFDKTNVPDATGIYDGEIININCVPYIACNAHWVPVVTSDQVFNVPAGYPTCLESQQDVNAYDIYQNNVANTLVEQSLISALLGQTFTPVLHNVCLHKQETKNPFDQYQNKLYIQESQYQWGTFTEDRAINLSADIHSNCTFIRWESSDANIVNSNNINTTANINGNASITGVISCT
jgi:hypothetical protein